jgi:two-component system chemotaxis response regulator CheY
MPAAADLAGLSIMLIDDSRPVRTVLKTLLLGLGAAQVYEGHDAEDAMVLACMSRPDVALIDYDLGQTTGLDLIRRFRTDPMSPNPALPILLLSPVSLPHLSAGAEEAGACGILPKPVNASTLGARIAALLDLPAPQIDAATDRLAIGF